MSVTVLSVDTLRTALESCLSPKARDWLALTGSPFEDGLDLNLCYACFADTSARLGVYKLREAYSPAKAGRLEPLPPEVGEWALDECGRVVLLAQASARFGADKFTELVESCYFQGETRERQGVARSLGFLPRTDRLLQIGLDACRTHVQPLFEAIACENRFPGEAFPEAAFNQLVLKALFMGVRLSRIVGLGSRLSSELQRMVGDYVDERRAAGRPVPSDVALILTEKDASQ
ncbi:MAG: EboA domain-containing protein [Nitrospirae bacterium]|nr:EboA domain-containing protein [Nitrospirota bacterium]